MFEGRIFTVTEDDVWIEKTGQMAKREIVHHHGGVGIMAYVQQKILLVKQYRYAIGQDTLEIPAGKLEAGEDPAACAVRELEEETGYRALDPRPLITVLATPGYCTEQLHLYITTQVEKLEHPHLGDEDEDVTYQWYDLEQCLEMIRTGQITDAKTVIAILSIKASL